jgi:dCMP deaminase
MEDFTLSKTRQRYFLEVALKIAQASHCLSRKIGAVLVTTENQVISTGYNGPPRGVTHCGLDRYIRDPLLSKHNSELISPKQFADTCPRRLLGFQSGEGLKICPAAHAERNALIQAARYGIPTQDTILCLTCEVPCKDCLIELINAGVRTVYVTATKLYDNLSRYLILESGIKILPYD